PRMGAHRIELSADLSSTDSVESNHAEGRTCASVPPQLYAVDGRALVRPSVWRSGRASSTSAGRAPWLDGRGCPAPTRESQAARRETGEHLARIVPQS